MKDCLTILERMKKVGITTSGACGDIMRNITGCPVAGVDREEYFDPSPVLQKINDYMTGRPEFSNLPRKYKISISACKTWCPHPEINCVALVGTERRDGGKVQHGFDLRLGGGLSTSPYISQRVGVFVTPEQAQDVVVRTTEIYRDTPECREKRHRSRLKFLIADWGVQKFRTVLEERLGYRLTDASPDYQEPEDAYRDHVGVHAQKQPGLFYVGVPVLVGRITTAQMRKVADLSKYHADGTLRLTNRQNLIILNIPEANVEKVLAGLAETGLSVNAHPARRSLLACTGTEFCKLAITETKARGREIVEHLEQRVPMDEPLRIHVTGCPNSCAQMHIAHIGLQGSQTRVNGQVVEAYEVFLGGRMGRGATFNDRDALGKRRASLARIPASEVKHRLEALLRTYLKQRKPGESFNDFCARVGDAPLVQVLAGGNDPKPKGDVPVNVPKSDGPGV
jgi:sulfite reductase beta subunit-like hemoprotein